MTVDLNGIWRNSKMWPEESISLVAQIQLGEGDFQSQSRYVETYASSPYEKKKTQQSNDWKISCVSTLDALARNPNNRTATVAYKALGAGYLSPYASIDVWDTLKPVVNSWRDANLNDVLSSFLQYIIEGSPNIIAVHNGMFFLNDLQTSINTDLIVALGLKTNRPLADQACRLIEKTLPKGREKERIVFSLVKAGTSTITGILLANTNRQSDRNAKDWILKKLFADPWPHGYVIDDYIGYLLEYIDKGDLLSAISAANPDDALISGTLEVYTHLVRGLDHYLLAENSDHYEEETEILFRLIDHLVERELSLTDLEYLSQIYNALFYWTIIDDAEWLKKGGMDQEAAQKILDVYEHALNKKKLDAALYATDSDDFYTAFEIVTNIREADAFEIIFEATKNASHPMCLNMLAEQIKNESQARKAIDWAIDRYHIKEDGYGVASGAPGYNSTLKALAEVAGDYPGLGGRLILAGLNYGTTAHEVAAKALLKWPPSHWPDDALGKLNQAVKNTQRTLGLLNDARDKLEDANSGTAE